MLKMIGIPLLAGTLFAALAFNKSMQIALDSWHWIMDRPMLSGSAACLLILLFFVTGCSTQDVAASLKLTRLGANAAGLVKAWDGDKLILEKYRDLLADDNPDRQQLTEIITSGDDIQQELALLVVGGRVPSVAGLQMLFAKADTSVVAGAEMYRKHIEAVAFSDRMRAQEFGNTWAFIKGDLAALTDSSGKSERYELAKEILSFMLAVTGQVVIPALAANGKI